MGEVLWVRGGARQHTKGWFGRLSLFSGQVFRGCFHRAFEFTEVLRRVFEIGWRSAPLIVLSGFAGGAVLPMHTRSTLERFGATTMIPAALALALVKKTAPWLRVVIPGRVGAGIGAEFGGMRVTEQIDALEPLANNSRWSGFQLAASGGFDVQQLPYSLQILHLAPVETPVPQSASWLAGPM